MTAQDALAFLLREAHSNQLAKRMHPGDARVETRKVSEAGEVIRDAFKGSDTVASRLTAAEKELADIRAAAK